jgi:ZIP family zinc transporter
MYWSESGGLTLAGQALMASLLAGLASGMGGLIVAFLPNPGRRVYDALLGFSAGVMLSAAALVLLWPALEAGGAWSAIAGMLAGGLLILGLERTVPHLEPHFGPRFNGVGGRFGLLLAAAIALHNLPEGLSVGVAYAHDEGRLGAIVALAIAAQNVPEGLAVALPIRTGGGSRTSTMLWALGSGLVEPLGAAAGFHLVSVTRVLVPFGLALAAGAMVFVASDQLIPESRFRAGDKAPTVALLAGFVLVATLVRWGG